MAIALHNPSDFDHTVGCWATNYVLVFALLLSLVLSVHIWCSTVRQFHTSIRNRNVRILMCIGIISILIYDVLAATVHQSFLSDFQIVVFSTIWQVSVCFGFFGFIQFGVACIISIVRAPTYVILISLGLGILMFGLCFAFSKISFTVLTYFTFVDIFLAIVCGCVMYAFSRKHPILSPFYRVFFGLMWSAVVLIAVGTIVQRLGADIHENYFNHNAIYHICLTIAFPFLFVTWVWTPMPDDWRPDAPKKVGKEDSSEQILGCTKTASDGLE